MRIQIRYGWHVDSRAERLQDTAASGTAGNQPPHRTRNAATKEAVNGVNAGAFTRRHTLLPEHATIKKVKKKGNTDRLHKAMGLK